MWLASTRAYISLFSVAVAAVVPATKSQLKPSGFTVEKGCLCKVKQLKRNMFG